MKKDLDLLTKDIIERLKARGADLAWCSAAVKETREFNVDGGEFSLLRTLFDNSLTVTAVKDGKKGSVGLNSFEDEAVSRAIDDCLAAAEASHADDGWGLCPDANRESFTEGEPVPDLDRLFDRSRELLETIKREYPLIVMEQMIIDHGYVHKVYRNSNGAHFVKDSGLYGVELMFSAHEGEVASSFFSSGVATDNLDKPFISLGSIRRDLADVQKQLYTVSPKEKFTGTMVLTPACLADFMGSICDNFAGDGVLLEGTSIWKDKLGELVADERITVSFAPGTEGIVSGQSYTGEGYIAQDFDFIKNGRLESFLVSLYVANKTGAARAKNDGSGMVIAEGDKSIEDIIAGIDRGIIVGRFSGGDPATNGDFSGVAKNSFLIENGKVTSALSETMISGNLATMLKSLRDISSERVYDGTSILPYMAFDGITVSGK